MLVIAHRGASGNAPENTLAAVQESCCAGATFIETDLQLSRDAQFRGHSRCDGESNHERAGSRARHEAGGIAAA